VTTKNQVVLIIHEDHAWLCRGEWNRPVAGNEFIAWATYAGVGLRQVPGSSSQLVVFSTIHQERLFDLMWATPDE
jgi:hypothetical protein